MNNVEQVKTRARGLVMDQIDRRTTKAGQMLDSQITTLRTMSQTMRDQGFGATAGAVDYAAQRLGRVSSYLENTDGDRIVHDLEELARANPVVTGAIGVLLGLTAARLLKSSASERYNTYAVEEPQ